MIGGENGMIEKILRRLGYVKATELDVVKMECEGWKDAAQSWKRLALSRLKAKPAGFVYLGPRLDQEQEKARVNH